MGAYLNRPIVEKEKEEGTGGGFSYACTTMQGWRANQEDAHNCVVDLHPGWHMFAVYDGHGGTEVSKFVAAKLPDFLKTRQFWESENIEECLKTAFVEFDDVIRSEDSMKELKDIANCGKKKKPVVVDAQDEADRIDTIEESSIPIQELIQRYGSGGGAIGRSLLSAFLGGRTGDDSDDENEDEEEEEEENEETKEGEEKEEGAGDEDAAEKKEEAEEADNEEKEEPAGAGDHKKVKKRSNRSPIQSEAKKSKSEEVSAKEESTGDATEEAEVSTSSSGAKPASTEEEEEDSDQEFVADEEVDEEQSDEEMEEATDLSQFVLGAGGAETPGEDSGTTACVCLVGADKIVVANAGDSRAVLCRDGKAIDLSVDHKPEDEVERNRIRTAGGTIEDGRVNGGLNLSRALGDHAYKKNHNLPLKDQMITALPDIKIEKLTPEDEFVIVACDGIWNSMESQEVVDFARKLLAEGKTSADVCDALCDACLADSTDGDGTGCDNMTVICAVFQR